MAVGTRVCLTWRAMRCRDMRMGTSGISFPLQQEFP